jgi:hypothetical protein
VPSASFGEIEQFCLIDGWTALPPTDHQPYEKVVECPGLPPEVLATKVSFDRGKTPSYGLFKAILRTQLKVTEQKFRTALREREPVVRDCPPVMEVVPSLPAALALQLKRELRMTEADMAGLAKDDAVRLLQAFWSRPR